LNKNYPFQVWLKSVFISSLLLSFCAATFVPAGDDTVNWAAGVFFISLLFGGSFSWLIFLACYFLFKKLPKETPVQRRSIKVRMAALGILLMLVIGLFFGLSLQENWLIWLIPLCFTLGILLATLLTKIQISPGEEPEMLSPEEEEQEEEDDDDE